MYEQNDLVRVKLPEYVGLGKITGFMGAWPGMGKVWIVEIVSNSGIDNYDYDSFVAPEFALRAVSHADLIEIENNVLAATQKEYKGINPFKK